MPEALVTAAIAFVGVIGAFAVMRYQVRSLTGELPAIKADVARLREADVAKERALALMERMGEDMAGLRQDVREFMKHLTEQQDKLREDQHRLELKIAELPRNRKNTGGL